MAASATKPTTRSGARDSIDNSFKQNSVEKIQHTLDPIQKTFRCVPNHLPYWRYALYNRYLGNYAPKFLSAKWKDYGPLHSLYKPSPPNDRPIDYTSPVPKDLQQSTIELCVKKKKLLKIHIYFTTNVILVQGKGCNLWVDEEFRKLRAIVQTLSFHNGDVNFSKNVYLVETQDCTSLPSIRSSDQTRSPVLDRPRPTPAAVCRDVLGLTDTSDNTVRQQNPRVGLDERPCLPADKESQHSIAKSMAAVTSAPLPNHGSEQPCSTHPSSPIDKTEQINTSSSDPSHCPSIPLPDKEQQSLTPKEECSPSSSSPLSHHHPTVSSAKPNQDDSEEGRPSLSTETLGLAMESCPPTSPLSPPPPSTPTLDNISPSFTSSIERRNSSPAVANLITPPIPRSSSLSSLVGATVLSTEKGNNLCDGENYVSVTSPEQLVSEGADTISDCNHAKTTGELHSLPHPHYDPESTRPTGEMDHTPNAHPGNGHTVTDNPACCHDGCISKERYETDTQALRAEISALRSSLLETRQHFKIELDSLLTQINHLQSSSPKQSPPKNNQRKLSLKSTSSQNGEPKAPSPHSQTHPTQTPSSPIHTESLPSKEKVRIDTKLSHADFLQETLGTNTTTLLLGDSVIRGINLSRSCHPHSSPQTICKSGLTIPQLTEWLRLQKPSTTVKEVIIHIGVNDCKHQSTEEGISTDRWKQLINQCQNSFPKASLQASAIIPAKGRYPLNKRIRPSNKNLQLVCESMRGKVVYTDHSTVFTTTAGAPKLALYKDAIHPSKKGTACLALSLFPQLDSPTETRPLQMSQLSRFQQAQTHHNERPPRPRHPKSSQRTSHPQLGKGFVVNPTHPYQPLHLQSDGQHHHYDEEFPPLSRSEREERQLPPRVTRPVLLPPPPPPYRNYPSPLLPPPPYHPPPHYREHYRPNSYPFPNNIPTRTPESAGSFEYARHSTKRENHNECMQIPYHQVPYPHWTYYEPYPPPPSFPHQSGLIHHLDHSNAVN